MLSKKSPQYTNLFFSFVWFVHILRNAILIADILTKKKEHLIINPISECDPYVFQLDPFFSLGCCPFMAYSGMLS